MTGFEITGSFQMQVRPIAPSSIIPVVTLRYGSFTTTLKGDHMAYTLPIDHQVGVQVQYVDAKGNPATVDGAPEWESSNPSILAVTPDDPSGMTATVVPLGTVGNAQVTVTADADMGGGVREIVTLMDVTTVAGEAVAGTITPTGAAVPIPPGARTNPK